MMAISRSRHSAVRSRRGRGREVAAGARQRAQRRGLGADHRAGAVVPADLRVALRPAAVVEELERRLVVRVGRADADRGVHRRPEHGAEVRGQQQLVEVGPVRRGHGEHRHPGPAGQAQPGEDPDHEPVAPYAGGAQRVVGQRRGGADPAGREGQEELGVRDGRDDGVAGHVAVPRPGIAADPQREAWVGEDRPRHPAEAVLLLPRIAHRTSSSVFR